MNEVGKSISKERHGINKPEDIDFLVNWLKVLCDLYPDARGRVNSISISLTRKFVSIDSTNFIEISKVEGD